MSNYYVDSASSGGDGSNERPFPTLAEANEKAKSGDTVFATGMFRETLDLTTSNVTWKGNLATLDGGYDESKKGQPPDARGVIPGGEYSKMVQLNAPDVVFSGFTIQNIAGQPVGFTKQANGAKLLNCKLYHAYGGGIVADDCKDILIESVDMSFCNLKRFDDSNTGGGPAHVQVNLLLKNVTGGVIRGCDVHHNWGEGIGLAKGSKDCIVEDCTVHTNLHMHIVINGSHNNVIRNNFIYHTGDPDFFQSKSGEPPAGIAIANEKLGAERHDLKPASGNIISGNVVVGMGINFNARESKNSDGALMGTLVSHNTFINAVGRDAIGVKIPPSADHADSVFENNIIIQDEGIIIKAPGGAGVKFTYNLWSQRPADSASGEGSMVGEAFLVNHKAPLNKNVTIENYRLTAQSINAIGKASDGGDLGALPYVVVEPEPEPEEPPVEPEEPPDKPPVEEWQVHYAAFAEHSNAAVEAVIRMVAAWEAKEATESG